MSSSTDLTFADRVLASTHEVKLAGRRLSGSVPGVQSRYRASLLRAERYELDDDAVELICELSHEKERLPNWALLARLPFDAVWFELNLHAKLRKFERMNTLLIPFDPEQVSPVAGYLMFKDRPGSDDPRWVCHPWLMVDGHALPGLLSYVFDPEGDGTMPVLGSDFWHAPTLRRDGYPPTRITTDQGTGVSLVDPEHVACGVFEWQNERVTAPEWFASRSAVIVNPYWRAADPPRLRASVASEVTESRGEFRWVITMLAAINALPRAVRHVAGRPGRRLAHGHPLPYLGRSVLTLTLPRENRTVYARRRLNREAGAARKRWHKVAGFWRVAENSKLPPGTLCRHEPVLIDHNLAVCERCQLLIRWVKDFERGDPNLGIVTQERRISGRK